MVLAANPAPVRVPSTTVVLPLEVAVVSVGAGWLLLALLAAFRKIPEPLA